MSPRRKRIKTIRLYLNQKRRGVDTSGMWPYYVFTHCDWAKGIGRIEGIHFIETEQQPNQPTAEG